MDDKVFQELTRHVANINGYAVKRVQTESFIKAVELCFNECVNVRVKPKNPRIDNTIASEGE